MQIGDRIRIGAPYAHAFNGDTTVLLDVLRIGDELITGRVLGAPGVADTIMHVNLPLVLFIEVLPKGVEQDEKHKTKLQG